MRLKKFIPLLFALILPLAKAQVSNPSVRYVTSAPSGACSASPPIQIVRSTGTVYTCNNGTWAAVGGSSGSTPTTVIKQGSTAGTYTTTSTTPVAMDATNLSYTVTIPIGSKLLITSTFPYDPSTVAVIVGLYDGSTLLGSFGYTGPGVQPGPITVIAVITGDGASHTIQAKFEAGSAGTAQIYNQASIYPQMIFFLTPSS